MKVTKKQKEFEVLRPLLNAVPRYRQLYIPEDCVEGGKAVCTGCGAEDRQIMIRKHKRGCLLIAHYKAMEALRGMLHE